MGRGIKTCFSGSSLPGWKLRMLPSCSGWRGVRAGRPCTLSSKRTDHFSWAGIPYSQRHTYCPTRYGSLFSPKGSYVPSRESLILGFAISDFWGFQIIAQGRGNYFFQPTQNFEILKNNFCACCLAFKLLIVSQPCLSKSRTRGHQTTMSCL